jgi:hypothetical protein
VNPAADQRPILSAFSGLRRLFGPPGWPLYCTPDGSRQRSALKRWDYQDA